MRESNVPCTQIIELADTGDTTACLVSTFDTDHTGNTTSLEGLASTGRSIAVFEMLGVLIDKPTAMKPQISNISSEPREL